jgi:hypothetical protein
VEVVVMRYLTTAVVLLVVFSVIVLGCARAGGDPINPTNEMNVAGATVSEDADFHDSHMLWWQGNIFINEDHTSVDVVPMRQARLHLNALKFLESYCADCLQITKIKNNGDSTIDLTVKITHPFPDNPEYTGFDVKGIIMFNGSHKLDWWSKKIFPYGTSSKHNYFYVSWAEVGDPEVLNQDGYTVRWSPWWDSGSDLPIFNYWPGKYSHGNPTANLNAYLNFFTDEPRHMFRDDGEVERVYHIFLPPGPVAAGYAVEACWEPPTITPVTDPVNDFPISANQEEPYFFRFVINEGQPITNPELGPEFWEDCANHRYEWSQWYGHEPDHDIQTWPWWPDWISEHSYPFENCDLEPPPDLVYVLPDSGHDLYTRYDGQNGNYRGVAVLYAAKTPLESYFVTYTVFDFTLEY